MSLNMPSVVFPAISRPISAAPVPAPQTALSFAYYRADEGKNINIGPRSKSQQSLLAVLASPFSNNPAPSAPPEEEKRNDGDNVAHNVAQNLHTYISNPTQTTTIDEKADLRKQQAIEAQQQLNTKQLQTQQTQPQAISQQQTTAFSFAHPISSSAASDSNIIQALPPSISSSNNINEMHINAMNFAAPSVVGSNINNNLGNNNSNNDLANDSNTVDPLLVISSPKTNKSSKSLLPKKFLNKASSVFSPFNALTAMKKMIPKKPELDEELDDASNATPYPQDNNQLLVVATVVEDRSPYTS
jgi:hypothetical protein